MTDKVTRKLARWLPYSRALIDACWRTDMPQDMIHDLMTPEDWVAAAEEAVKRQEALCHADGTK